VESDNVSENGIKDGGNIVLAKKKMCEVKYTWILSGSVREKIKAEVWNRERMKDQ
jgi:hypothetical protein